MKASPTSFEEIDKHIQAADMGVFHLSDAAGAARSADTVLSKVCEVFQVIRPILKAIENFVFIPKKWRDAVASFVAVLDTLCPTT